MTENVSSEKQPSTGVTGSVSMAGRVADLHHISTPRRSLYSDAWYRLLRNKASVAGMVVLVIFFTVAIFANQLAPFSPIELHSGMDFRPPIWYTLGATGVPPLPQFVLGTDTLGRDVLSMVIHGARVSMVVGFVPTIMVLLIGVTLGLVSGYAGGWVDNLLMRFTDVIYAFPDLLFFIIVMVALRDTWLGDLFNGLFLLFGALALVNWVGEARIVRGQVLSLKEKEFVEAARCIGARDSRIMFRHILPNSLSPIIINAAFTVPAMIITEATLGFLGLGMRPTTNPHDIFMTSWGTMMLSGQAAINAQPWIILAPAICVSLVVLAFTFLGDGLRDALDPRLQGTQ
jgi:oligopeptide transport system permease protein